jgi:uncharacterized protein DUF6941
MIVIPKAVALTFCERMDVNPATGHVSLVGIFNSRKLQKYPASAQPFTIYTVLHDGFGEGTMELSLVQASTDTEIHRWRKWWASTRRLQIVNLEIMIRQCVFPAPGRYLANLRFENQLITHRHFEMG